MSLHIMFTLLAAALSNVMATPSLSSLDHTISVAFHPSAPNHRNIHDNYRRTQKTRIQPFDANHDYKLFKMTNADDMISSPSSKQRPGIIFPGGGLFFYWQAGVIAYLQEEGYNLSNTLLSGASAGALSATLAKTEVNPYDATELALSMADEAGIWDRPLGLQGVWGSIIYDWLDRLLPLDAEERVKEELHILLTPVPSFGKSRISQFENRQDLINANLASVHLPWFLDGNLTSNFRGKPHIDGSFLSQSSDYFPEEYSEKPKLILDYQRDPIMKDRASEFIKVVSKQTIWDILEQGKRHAKIMDGKGEFDHLPRL